MSALERKRQELTEYKVIEAGSRPEMVTTDRDVVVVSVEGAVGEQKGDKDGVMVDLSDTEHEPIPGLVSRLVGLPLDAADRALVTRLHVNLLRFYGWREGAAHGAE